MPVGQPHVQVTVAPSGQSIVLLAKDGDGNSTTITSVAPSSEVQAVQLTGKPSGDAFALTFDGQTTSPIPTVDLPPSAYITWTFPTIVGHDYTIAAFWYANNSAVSTYYGFNVYQSGVSVSYLATSGEQTIGRSGTFTDAGVFLNDGITLVPWLSVTPSPVTASVDSMQMRQTATTDPSNGLFWAGGIRVEDTTASTITYYQVTSPSENITLSPGTTWYYFPVSPSYGGHEYITFNPGGLLDAYRINPGETTAAAVLQTALQALSTIGTGNVTVVDNSGSGAGNYQVTFTGDLENLPQNLMTCGDDAVSITETFLGGSLVPTLAINGGDPFLLPNRIYDENTPSPYVDFPLYQSTPAVQTGVVGELPFNNYTGFHPDYPDNAALSKFQSIAYEEGATGNFNFTRLTPGTYQFAITYNPNSITNGPFTYTPYSAVQVLIKDIDGNILATYSVDQTQAPSDYSDQGVEWKILGSFTTTKVLATLTLVMNTVGLPGPVGNVYQVATLDAVQLTQTASAQESIVLTDEDTVVLTLRDGWLTTAAGPVPGGAITVTGPSPIMPPFVDEPKTMMAGMNTEAHVCFYNYHSHSNLAYASSLWSLVGDTDDDAYPITLFTSRDGGGNVILPVRTTVQLIDPGESITAGDPGTGTYAINSGKFCMIWDGDPGLGLQAGAWSTAELLDVPKPDNVTGNWAVYNVTHSEQSAGVTIFLFAESSTPNPDDETGNTVLFHVSNVRIFPPDPTDPSGNTIWGLNTETNIFTEPPKFHPWYLYKLQNMQSLRFLAQTNTNLNPASQLSHFKAVTHANRFFGVKCGPGPAVTRIQAPTGDPYFYLGGTSVAVMQFTTATPHALWDGAYIATTGCGTAEFEGASLNLDGIGGLVHVIDDTNFICALLLNPVIGHTMLNVLTPTTGRLNYTCYGSTWPIQDMVDLVVAVGCTDMWFNMPLTMDTTDGGGAYQVAALLASLTPRGMKIHIEVGNEIWNFNFQTYAWCAIQQSVLLQTQIGGQEIYSANQIKAIHDQCVAAFSDAGRRSDLIRIVGGQAGNIGPTGPTLAQLRTLGAEFEEFCVAPYFSNWPASFYNQDQCRIFDQMTTDQLLDYMEIIATYGGYPEDAIGNQIPVLASYGYGDVKMVGYEGGIGNLVPYNPVGPNLNAPGIDPNYALRQNAVKRHPRMYWIILQFAQSYQDIGMTHWEYFDEGGVTILYDWGLYESANQQRGTGDPIADAFNITNPQAKNQVVSEEGGAWYHWSTLSTPPKTTKKIIGGRNGQIRTIGYPRGMYRSISHH
jgi:hypothetical protein